MLYVVFCVLLLYEMYVLAVELYGPTVFLFVVCFFGLTEMWVVLRFLW